MNKSAQFLAAEHRSAVRDWLRRLVKEPWLRLQQSFERRQYHDLWTRMLSPTATNLEIIRLLQGSAPFLVSRLGQTEARILGEFLWRRSSYSRTTLVQAHQNAGIFPAQPWMLDRFAAIYGDALRVVDLLGFWQTPYQSRLIAQCEPAMQLGSLSALEPYGHDQPWSMHLEDKRILIVHPFVESIRDQYERKRRLIYPGRDVLPRFRLTLVKPPQTIAPSTGGFAHWGDALTCLLDQVLSSDFDIALIGCGAYGLPLGAAIKASGRQAIHLGGSLQLLFGIRGRRWEHMPAISSMMNDDWVRPSAAETPPCASLVDGGCYW
jgi:hypothetical protein